MLRSQIPIIACHFRFAHWPEFKNELQPASQCVVFDGCPEDNISFKMKHMDRNLMLKCCFFVCSLLETTCSHRASFIVIDL